MAVYSIRDLENLSGIKAHTIRIWEKRYNLIEPHRTNTNIRYYTDYELKKILNVAVLNKHGIKISNIAKLNDVEMKEEIMRVSDANPDLKHAIDSLIIAMIDMDEIKFSSIISKSVSKKGFKGAMLDVIYPFLNRIGVMWQAGDVNPNQEHFVSYLIRQKVIAAIDDISGVFRTDAKTFLLFLPEGEWHEIGLLFASYLIKETGHKVIYLGQSVPYKEVLATGATKQIDHFLLSVVTSQPEYNFISYLKDLGGAFPDKKILFFTSFLKESAVDLPDNYRQLVCVPDLVGYLGELE
jgi:MerR family transcriptional regulator, light-induced transcriptional regulator